MNGVYEVSSIDGLVEGERKFANVPNVGVYSDETTAFLHNFRIVV